MPGPLCAEAQADAKSFVEIPVIAEIDDAGDRVGARESGHIPATVRFQVSLPTPLAVVMPFCRQPDAQQIVPAYERAMQREVERICAAIPHRDLAIQWDVCIEMIQWDGRVPTMPPFPGMEQVFAGNFKRLAAMVPADVELGFHRSAEPMMPSMRRSKTYDSALRPSSISGSYMRRTASKEREGVSRRRRSMRRLSASPLNAASRADEIPTWRSHSSRPTRRPPRSFRSFIAP